MVDGQKVTGTAKYNGYYAIPLFTPIYGAPHNPNGMSGDIHTKRLSWEMLAAYGYYEGMVPYLSNQLKPGNVAQNTQFSDDVIISKVSGGTYPTMAAFKKAQYAERIAKKDTLKPITINWEGKTQQITTYAQLKELMDAAVEDDLKNNHLQQSGWYSKLPTKTKVEQLKSAIFLAYKTNTNQFATNIYKDAPKTYTVTYRFNDFDALPEDVKKLLPTPQTDIAAGSTVTLAQPAKKQVVTDKGIYDFKGWEPKTITNIAKDETVTGTWTFTAYVTPKAPSSLDEDFTEGGNEYIGSYTLPEVEGVEYLVDGKVVTGKVNVSPNQADVNAPVTVTVTARAKDGYSLKPSATSSWKFTFTRVSDKERYNPFADPISLTVGDTLPLPKDVVKFPDTPGQMPTDLGKVKYAWKAPTPSTDTVGKIQGIITVTYADGSSEEITVKVIVKADEQPGTDPTEPGTQPGGDVPGTTPNPGTGKPETKPAGEGASSPKPGQSAPATAGKKPALSNTGSVGLAALALLASLSTAGALLLSLRRKSAEKQ